MTYPHPGATRHDDRPVELRKNGFFLLKVVPQTNDQVSSARGVVQRYPATRAARRD